MGEPPSDDEPTELFELFRRAVALSENERASFLADLRRKSPALAAELAELLLQDADGGPVPDAISQKRSLVESLVEDLVREREPGPDPPSSAIMAQLAARVPASSRYTIQGELARGGMGAILRVWDEDLGRSLAMKVALGEARIEPSGETPPLDARTLARFLEEAQVTGQLDHPGIVPVHELGMDREGRVYFTMRLVKGRHLGLVFDLVKREEEGWNQTRTLGVLLKVCEAMAYAHSNGIVHRDLKPSNVMVGGFGEVYVMDWGLARARGRRESAPTPTREAPAERGELLKTRAGSVLGTPGYMSPEQAAGHANEVDERSDVYALGAMLYELLSGDMPHRRPGEDPTPLALVARLLAGPPPPLASLAPQAPPELVAICEKAMSHERLARYREMGELAEDLRAYLEGRVVNAFETGAWAEARKWVQRNRAFAGALAAGVLTLVAGLSVSLVLKRQSDRNAVLAAERGATALANASLADEQKRRAEENAQLAEHRRVEAEQNAALADQRRVDAERSEAEARRQQATWQEIARFLVEIFESASPAVAEGRETTARELLDQGRRKIEQGVQADPLVRAQLLSAMGRAFGSLGASADAEPLLSEALRLSTLERGESHPETIEIATEFGVLLRDMTRYAEADRLLSATTDRALADLGTDHRATLGAIVVLASIRTAQGHCAESAERLQSLLPRAREVCGREDEITVVFLGELANAYQCLKRPQETEELRRECYETSRVAFGDDNPRTLVALMNLATATNILAKFDETVVLLQDCLERSRRVLGARHLVVLHATSNLAACYLQQGRLGEAATMYRELLDDWGETLGADHPLRIASLSNLATTYRRSGREAEAEALYLDVLEGSRLREDDPSLLQVSLNLGELYRSQERFAEAEPHLKKALNGLRGRLEASHPEVLACMLSLAQVQAEMDRLAEAEELCAEALETARAHGDATLLRRAEAIMEEILSRSADR